MDIFIIASGIAAYLALGSIYWSLGQRQTALKYFEDATVALALIFIVQLIFSITSELASMAGLNINLWNSLEVSNICSTASGIFWDASRKAVDMIFFVETEKAILASTPLTAPLVSVLSGATGWSLSELSLVAIFYMHFSFVAQVFSMVSSYLFALGTTLTPIPRLRKIGISLVSLYLSTSLAIAFSSQVTAEALSKIRVPQAINPTDWINIAGIIGDAAVELGRSLTLSIFASTLATIGGIGLASIFDTVMISVLRT